MAKKKATTPAKKAATKRPAKKAAAKRPAKKAATRPAANPELAALRARVKRAEGGKLTQRETRAIAADDKRQSTAIADNLLRQLPKGLYCQLAGRQHKLIDDAARHYGLPLDGATVDLFAAIAALHDLIANNAAALNRSVDDDELESELLRQRIGKLEKENERLAIGVKRDRAESIDRSELVERLTWLSSRLRAFGQKLDAKRRDQLNELLTELADQA